MNQLIDGLDAALPPEPHRPLPSLRWIPVRSLAPRHRPRLIDHLQALQTSDRMLRFGHIASDAQIERYVARLDFEHDEVFGVFDRRLELVAMAHLASLGGAGQTSTAAEFGVSVSARLRGRGLGARLFDHAVLRARNRGIDTLIVHALSENTAMLHIARQAGAVVERDGPESTARLRLPAEDLASQLAAYVSAQAAEFDYGAKLHARRVDGLLGRLSTLCDHRPPPLPGPDLHD